jgi:hypothetical protein
MPSEAHNAMRFFLQPAPSSLSFAQKGALRRRELIGCAEYEYQFSYDNVSLYGVFYSLNQFPGMFATNFGAGLQPLRSLIFGNMTERGRRQVIAEFDRSRPTFMAAIRNGIALDFKKGGFYTWKDANDGRSKVLLIVALDEAESSLFTEGKFNNLYINFLAASFQIWQEAIAPLDANIFQSQVDWEGAARQAASGAKWIVENASNIQLVLHALGIG